MKIFGKTFFESEERAIENPNIPISDPRVMDEIFNIFPTASGESVNEMSAMQLSAVYACVRVLSESVASLPLILYKRTGNGKERATEHPLFKLMHDCPSPNHTSYTFREVIQGRASLWGNGYAFIEYMGNGMPSKLVPICTPCLLYTSPSPRDGLLSRMPSSA